MTRFAWTLPPMGEGWPVPGDLALRRGRAQAPRRDGEEKLDLMIRQSEIGGLASHVIEPSGAVETIVHLHGGGYRSGSSSSWCPFGARLAAATSTRVILPDYPLAPEAPFPAALHALTGLYEQLVAEDTPVVFSGDSAGGGLAAAFTASCTDAGAPVPAGLVLLSPWLDLTVSAESYVTRQHTDELFSATSASDAVEFYLQGRYQATHPLASPLFADPTSFPPVLLFAGGDEVLIDDAVNYVAHLARNGVSVSSHLVAGMQHEWPVQSPDLMESRYAMDDIAQFIERVFTARRARRPGPESE